MHHSSSAEPDVWSYCVCSRSTVEEATDASREQVLCLSDKPHCLVVTGIGHWLPVRPGTRPSCCWTEGRVSSSKFCCMGCIVVRANNETVLCSSVLSPGAPPVPPNPWAHTFHASTELPGQVVHEGKGICIPLEADAPVALSSHRLARFGGLHLPLIYAMCIRPNLHPCKQNKLCHLYRCTTLWLHRGAQPCNPIEQLHCRPMLVLQMLQHTCGGVCPSCQGDKSAGVHQAKAGLTRQNRWRIPDNVYLLNTASL